MGAGTPPPSDCLSCYVYGVICALVGASLQAVGLQVCVLALRIAAFTGPLGRGRCNEDVALDVDRHTHAAIFCLHLLPSHSCFHP